MINLQLLTIFTVAAVTAGNVTPPKSTLVYRGIFSGPRLNTDLINAGDWTFFLGKGKPTEVPDGTVTAIVTSGGHLVDLSTIDVTPSGVLRAQVQGQLIQGTAFNGSTWSFVSDQSVRDFILEEVTIKAMARQYRFVDSITHQSICEPDQHGNDKLRFVPGISIADGVVNFAPSQLLAACESGAAAKAEALGDPVGQTDDFQAGLRLLRADYCADGHAYTTAGTEIYVYEGGMSAPLQHIEAVWDEDGALCLTEPRSETPPCSQELPPCTQEIASIGTFVTYTADPNPGSGETY